MNTLPSLETLHEHASKDLSYCATPSGQWVKIVRDAVGALKFGEVHLTVHQGRVVEVRKVEKVRFAES